MDQPNHEDDHSTARTGEEGANRFVVNGEAFYHHQTQDTQSQQRIHLSKLNDSNQFKRSGTYIGMTYLTDEPE